LHLVQIQGLQPAEVNFVSRVNENKTVNV
jgi:hypothetical protein